MYQYDMCISSTDSSQKYEYLHLRLSVNGWVCLCGHMSVVMCACISCMCMIVCTSQVHVHLYMQV